MTGSQLPTAGRQRAPGETPGGELEALRIWLLGGFRISVGSSRSIGKTSGALRKPAASSSCSPWHQLTASTANRRWTCSGWS
jgi:hypothetical protein